MMVELSVILMTTFKILTLSIFFFHLEARTDLQSNDPLHHSILNEHTGHAEFLTEPSNIHRSWSYYLIPLRSEKCWPMCWYSILFVKEITS